METDDHYNEAKQIAENYLTGDEIVVLDGYHFRTEYQKILKAKGCKVVCIDDIHAYHFVADVVINHAPGLDKKQYSIEPYTLLCFGLDYSLLRKPFLEAAKKKSKRIDFLRTVFICFGGADFNNITGKVLNVLLQNKTTIEKIYVVLGHANKFKSDINNYLKQKSKYQIEILSGLSADQMIYLMQDSDLAIVPASSILYEIIAVKMPVISGYYVDNQKDVYKGFKDLGLIHGVGDLNTFERYTDIIEEVVRMNIQSDIDLQVKYQKGESKENFIKLFNQISIKDRIKVRQALPKDVLLYFNWANDPCVRKNAISTERINEKNHRKWFQNKLDNWATTMFVFELDGKSFGQVRFDIEENDIFIDYSIDKFFRGKGLSVDMLRLGIEAFRKDNRHLKWNSIKGIVKLENTPSTKVFEKLYFNLDKIDIIRGEKYRIFSLPFNS